jgi:hypothetical protein
MSARKATVRKRKLDAPLQERKRAAPELTVEIGRTIVAAIAAGNFPSVSARIAGIKPGTLTKWLERGDQGEQPYADFAAAYQRAETQCEAEAVQKWRTADDWRAAERFVSKRFRENWGDRADTTGSGAISSLFNIHIHLDTEDPRLAAWEKQQRQQRLAIEKSTIATTSTPVEEPVKDVRQSIIKPVKDPSPNSALN